MSARFLYGALLIASFAMMLFVGGFVCLQLGFSLLMALFYAIAGKVMLLAFGLLVLLGAVALSIAVARSLTRYFSCEMKVLRRLLAMHSFNRQVAQRALLEKRQLLYLSRLKRERFFRANNRKHLRNLFGSIHQELHAVKPLLPETTYKSLRKALRAHHRHADAEAMLALRKQFSCRG